MAAAPSCTTLVAIAVLGNLLCFAAPSETESDSYFKLAMQQADAGLTSAAEESYLQAVRFNPRHGEAHNRLGQLRASAGDFAGAVQSCSEVVRLYPTSGGALANLAYMQTLHPDNRLAEAESNYRSALRLEPSHALAHSGLAGILHAQGDVVAAEKAWRTALRFDSKLPLPHESLGQLYEQSGKDKEASRRYRAALKIDPSHGVLHRRLGGLQQKLGKFADAEKRYRSAIKLSPTDAEQADTHKWLGLLLLARGATKEARAVLEEAAHLRRKAAGGRPPVSLLLSLEELGKDEFMKDRKLESKQFRAACRDSAAKGNPWAEQLPIALKAVRRMENAPSWIAGYLIESFAVLGFAENKLPSGSSYGAVWFPGFQAAVAKARATAATLPQEQVLLVFGSALGEQCIFAAAMGMRCIGYDILCNSTVQPSQALMSEHGLSDWIQLRCGDVAEVANDAELIGSVTLVFLNDYTWGPELRLKVQQRLSHRLSPGAALVSFSNGAWDSVAEERLQVVSNLTIRVSWGDVQVHIRQKKSDRPDLCPQK